MKRVIAYFLLLPLIAGTLMAAGIKVSEITWTGSGTEFYANFTAGGDTPEGSWTDTNSYALYEFETTNSTQSLMTGDWTEGTFNASNKPSVAAGPSYTIVGTNSFGRVEHGYTFDGASQYFQIGEHAEFEGTNNFSIGCWIKAKDKVFNRTIFGKWSGSAGWLLYIRSTGSYAYYSEDGGALFNLAIASVTTNTWEHIACVIDRGSATQGLTVYHNGIQQASSGDGTALGSIANATDCAIAFGQGGQAYFANELDDVFYASYAMTSNSIWDIYSNTHPTNNLRIRD